MTVSPWGTAESRVTLAVASLTVTVPVPFRPPLTVKELPAGSEPVSRSSLKVTVSAVPLTAALENAGAVVSGVLLVTALAEKLATSLPAASCSGLEEGLE